MDSVCEVSNLCSVSGLELVSFARSILESSV